MTFPMPHDADALARQLLPVVLGWCHRLGGRGVDPEEAAHDILLTVIKRADDRDAAVPIDVFAWGVTRRVLANHRRRAWWRRWLGAPADLPDDGPLLDVDRRDTARRVAALLEQLPDLHREVLVLCDIEERTSAEVAVLLGIPDATVRSRLRLARERFRALAPRFHLTPPSAP